MASVSYHILKKWNKHQQLKQRKLLDKPLSVDIYLAKDCTAKGNTEQSVLCVCYFLGCEKHATTKRIVFIIRLVYCALFFVVFFVVCYCPS